MLTLVILINIIIYIYVCMIEYIIFKIKYLDYNNTYQTL